MKRITAIAVLLMLCLNSRAQNALQLHDSVPDTPLVMVNYKTNRAKLHDFNSSLLILEFWSPSCSYCAHQVAMLDKLQQQFAGTLSILPVSTLSMGDDAATISHFIKGYKQRVKDGFILPVAVADTVLIKAFPVSSVPDYVWIHKGRYIAHTLPEAVTAENITAVIDGCNINLPQKPAPFFYDPAESIAGYITSATNVKVITQHLYEGEIKGAEELSGFTGDSANGRKIFAINQIALSLYRLAYKVPVSLGKNRIISLIRPGTVFNNGQVYSYEFNGQPGDDYNLLRRQMQADLRAYFKIKGSVEQKEMPCYILQAGDTGRLGNSGHIKGNSLYETIPGERLIYNQPVTVLAERLNQLLDIPVLDETGLKKPIDLRLPNNLTDMEAMQHYLEKQGILLKKALRTIDVFVLTPAEGSSNGLFTQ